METSYEVYAQIGQKITDPTLINGRYASQKYAEHFIIGDVINKLKLDKADVLLDIGCGAGIITLPLACVVNQVYGIDNPAIINKLKDEAKRYYNCEFYAGEWLKEEFFFKNITKIVAYSVLHYLRSIDDVIRFIDKAILLLPEQGKLLLGDIPNTDKKKRFLQTDFGKNFDKEFKKSSRVMNQEENIRDSLFAAKESTVEFNDKSIYFIMEHYRQLGHEVYVLPQDPYLPFGYTREDLLIVKG